MEIVSPPLRGRKGERMIEKVMGILNRIGCRVVNSCGSHVHQEARDLSLAGMQRVVSNYNAARLQIDRMVAKSRRGISNTYCQPWSSHDLANLQSRDSLTGIAGAQSSRYKAINLHAYPRYGTVEFRQHQGTLNAAKAIAWIRFSRHMMDAAARGVVIIGTDLDDLLTAISVDAGTVRFLQARTRQLAA
jgi:hypothetical protein